MANILQLVNKSKTLEEKARLQTQEVLKDMKKNNINSPVELMYRVYISMKAFYESIGKPSMTVRYAKDSPSSSDYNDTMNEIKADIKTISTECDNLNSVLRESYNQMELDRTTIDNMITNAKKKLEKARFKVEEANGSDVFIESFTSKNYFDVGACINEAAFINTTYQYISLATTEFNNLNEKTSIHLLDGSNGFPGNTHQATLTDEKVKYVGESNLRMNLADILDESFDTWFEYELFKVSDDTLIKTLGLGFNYDEGIKWITSDGVLHLSLAIRFAKAEMINTLSLSPFISSDKDSLPCLIESITISDGRGTIREILSAPETFNDSKVYSFPKQYCTEAIIELSQEIPYKTTIGHTYFKETPHSNIDYYKTNSANDSNIVDGTMPSVSFVGMTYNDREKRYIQPYAKYGEALANESYIKQALFDLPDEADYKMPYTETLAADRFCIGVRDIGVSNYKYSPISDYVSNNYEVKKPISTVSIESNEFIPETFDTDVDWIKYYFTLNDGVDWHPIVPIGLFKKEGYNKYLINSGTPAEFRDGNTGYIETSEDNYNIRVKIELSRPINMSDSEFYTPVVYEYKLQL